MDPGPDGERRQFTLSRCPALRTAAGPGLASRPQREDLYIRRIEEICRLESIDTIFPSFDPHVYVFAKNKERFERSGILIVGPDYEQVVAPLDKYSSVKAAEAAGLPVPKTFLPTRDSEIDDIAERIGPPWVIRNSTAATISSSLSDYRPQIGKLVKSLKWWGGLTIQAKNRRSRRTAQVHGDEPPPGDNFVDAHGTGRQRAADISKTRPA